jgi:putative addiction module CopG family antidote
VERHDEPPTGKIASGNARDITRVPRFSSFGAESAGMILIGFNRVKVYIGRDRDDHSMRKTRSLSVTLPSRMAQMVKDKVKSGDYASESEVIREGLRALQAQDSALEQWLQTEGVARYDAYCREPENVRPATEVFDRLRARHLRHAGKARD